jgi:hypothetical protein
MMREAVYIVATLKKTDRSVSRVNCCWPSPAQSFLVPSPVEHMTTFFCFTEFLLKLYIKIQFILHRKHTHLVYKDQPVYNCYNLFTETIADYNENHVKHTDSLFGHKAEFLYIKESGIYSNHSPLKC